MSEEDLNYKSNKKAVESLGLSNDWKISDGLGGFVKVSHSCGIHFVGGRNSGYSVVKGSEAVATSLTLKSAYKYAKELVAPPKAPKPADVKTKEAEPKKEPVKKPAVKKASKKTKGK